MYYLDNDLGPPEQYRDDVAAIAADVQRHREIEALMPELVAALAKADAWIEVFGLGHEPHTTAGSERAKILATIRPLYERAKELLR